ncbi:MAG: phosphodiester glycosidase family protein [Actinomycetota bacterium]
MKKRSGRVFHVLTLRPGGPSTLDVSLAGTKLPAYLQTSKIVRSLGGIAGTNGDFGLTPGRPAHLAAVDGELLQTSVLGDTGRAFGLSADESVAYAGRPRFEIEGFDPVGTKVFDIARWNEGAPRNAEIAGYSPVGGTIEPTPSDACSARLMPVGARRWGDGMDGTVQTYSVDAVRCGSAAMDRYGGTVIAARNDGAGAALISGLIVGEQLDIAWSVGWPGVLDIVGGSVVLVRDGQIAVTACNKYLCLSHPRTGIGVTAEGKIILVVVDGRSLRSGGATIVGFAKLMRNLGAVDALNLDGGGSSTMVVNGKVVNSPADGVERTVTSGVVVLPGSDAGEIVAGP